MPRGPVDRGDAEDSEGSFDDDLKRLEEAVRDLEGGRLGLDRSLERFEDGVVLTERLRARLEAAEGRVEALLDDDTTEELDVE